MGCQVSTQKIELNDLLLNDKSRVHLKLLTCLTRILRRGDVCIGTIVQVGLPLQRSTLFDHLLSVLRVLQAPFRQQQPREDCIDPDLRSLRGRKTLHEV